MGEIKNPRPGSEFYLPPEIFRHVIAYCRCYPRWKNASAHAGISAVNYDGMPHGTDISRPTENAVVSAYRDYAPHKCRLIEETVREVDSGLYQWLLRGVTRRNATYNYLRGKLGIPCGKNLYFKKRQEFYWRLAQKI